MESRNDRRYRLFRSSVSGSRYDWPRWETSQALGKEGRAELDCQAGIESESPAHLHAVPEHEFLHMGTKSVHDFPASYSATENYSIPASLQESLGCSCEQT